MYLGEVPIELADRMLWRVYAQLYDALLGVYAYRDMVEQVARLADCNGRIVLDAGTGTGNVAGALLCAGAARVVAVDASGAMMDRAERKLARAMADGRVRTVRDDIVRMMSDLPDASIDRITAVNVLYALTSREAFFGQARRVLRPSGYVLASHTTRPGFGPIVREQVRRGGPHHLVRPSMVGLMTLDLVIDLLARGGRFEFAPVSRVAAEAAAAGLPVTRSLGRTYGGPGDGVNELLRISAG
jgi:SAM-dependent methyltransferase